MDERVEPLNMLETIKFILDKWWILVLFSVISAVLTFVVTVIYVQPVYEAETTLFIGKEKNDIGQLGISLSDLQVKNKLVVDYKQIASTRLVINEVLQKLQLQMSIDDFRSNLFISTIEDSRFFTVSFKDHDPVLVAKISNELAKQLTIVAAEIVGVESIRIIDEAIVPDVPSSPHKIRSAFIAGIIGFMIGLLVVFILIIFDNTIENEEDIETLIGLPVIGTIPKY